MVKKNDLIIFNFHELLESNYDRDLKTVFDQFKARVDEEYIFATTVGKFSLHNPTFLKEFMMFDFEIWYPIETDFATCQFRKVPPDRKT